MTDKQYVVYPVPADDLFRDEDGLKIDYIDASDIEATARQLINNEPNLRQLRDANIVYLWRRCGGHRKGLAVLGTCSKPRGIVKAFTEADYVITMSADNLRGKDVVEIEATLYHELKHCGMDEDGKWVVMPHDVEEFVDVIRKYGADNTSIQYISKAE